MKIANMEFHSTIKDKLFTDKSKVDLNPKISFPINPIKPSKLSHHGQKPKVANF